MNAIWCKWVEADDDDNANSFDAIAFSLLSSICMKQTGTTFIVNHSHGSRWIMLEALTFQQEPQVKKLSRWIENAHLHPVRCCCFVWDLSAFWSRLWNVRIFIAIVSSLITFLLAILSLYHLLLALCLWIYWIELFSMVDRCNALIWCTICNELEFFFRKVKCLGFRCAFYLFFSPFRW